MQMKHVQVEHAVQICCTNKYHYTLTRTGCLEAGPTQKQATRVKIVLIMYFY